MGNIPNSPAQVNVPDHGMADLAGLAVVIPTHARSSLLKRTIESVARCRAPGNRTVRVWVVENGGKEGVEPLLGTIASPFPLIYRYCPTANKSAALNSVLPEIGENLVVFLDDDVRVHPEVLCAYAEASERHRSLAFFGGGMLVDYERTPATWMFRYLPLSAKGWNPRLSEYTPDEVFLGCNWAGFATDLIAVGGFDVTCGPGAESGATGQETVMQRQLRAVGCRPVYVPTALVWHYVPESRCSPSWALRRARRNAAASAQRLPGVEGGKTLGGRPLWLYRKLMASALAWASSLWSGPERRFSARHRMSQCLGTFDGFKRRRR